VPSTHLWSQTYASIEESDAVNESFRSDVRAPASARRAVEPLNKMLSETQVGMLGLLVSEVVANGVLYGDHASRIYLRGDTRRGRVWIEVTNAPNGSRPQAMAGDPQCIGLQLVQQMAADWGHQTDGRESRVWFELDPSIIWRLSPSQP
jgi:two-component sensor histidine kinase